MEVIEETKKFKISSKWQNKCINAMYKRLRKVVFQEAKGGGNALSRKCGTLKKNIAIPTKPPLLNHESHMQEKQEATSTKKDTEWNREEVKRKQIKLIL